MNNPVENMLVTETLDCPLCGSGRYEKVYSRIHYLEDPIGAIELCLVICRHCGFIYQNPQLSVEYLKWHYRKHSSGATYNEKIKGTRVDGLIRERKNFIEKFLTGISGNVIDVGGGQGDLLSCLNLPDCHKCLIEPSDAINRIGMRDDIKIYNISIDEL